MTIDRRLHHAARELREVRIDVPPLGMPPPAPRRFRLQAVAAPMLFVAGAALAMGVMQNRAAEPVHTDIPAVPSVVDAGPVPSQATNVIVPAPSARAELEMIAEFIKSNGPAPAPTVISTEPADVELASAGPI